MAKHRSGNDQWPHRPYRVVEDDTRIIYAATATGGLWKTVNNGTTWKSVFEKEGLYRWAPWRWYAPTLGGTGEDFNARSNSWGDGVYKSEDAGKTWEHLGLEETRHTTWCSIPARATWSSAPTVTGSGSWTTSAFSRACRKTY